MIHGLRVLRFAALVEMRYIAANRFMLFVVLVQPFFVALTTMFMLRRGVVFDPTYVVIGATLTGMWSLALFNSNWAIGGERRQGTLEVVVGTPTSFLLVLSGKMLGTSLLSFASLVVCYTVVAWLFGYAVTVAEPWGFVPSVALTLGALWATSMLIAPLGILWRWVGSVLNMFEYPVYMLGGFLFPVVMLPTWSLPVSWALPPFWAATALHATGARSVETGQLVAVWSMLVLTSAAAVLVARLLFRVILRRALVGGSLALT